MDYFISINDYCVNLTHMASIGLTRLPNYKDTFIIIKFKDGSEITFAKDSDVETIETYEKVKKILGAECL